MDRLRRIGRGIRGLTRTATLAIALAAVLLAGAGFLTAYLLGWTALVTPGERRILNSETFYNGVSVDGISLGGITREEARQRIEAGQNLFVDTTGVTVAMGEQSWLLKIADTPHTFDTETVLDEAWNLGREGSNMERLAAIEQLAQNPVQLTTTVSADPTALEQRVRDLAAPFERAPVDAEYLGYDVTKPEEERLSFSPDIPGERVDDDALWADVKRQFEKGTFGTVQMQTLPVQAAVGLDELKSRLQLVRRWNSVIKDHSRPRLANITLASAAFSGRFLQPGEVISFNETTGERTAAKGYQVAHVINGGVTDNGLAGGVCQVSGTLWNGAVRADLEIVERVAHTLKSAYMKAGEDATVDFPRLDLKIRNNKQQPVLLILYVAIEKGVYKLYTEIYGIPLEPDITIELKSERTKTVPAPAGEPRYVPSDAVKRGTTETNKPRNGEWYTTYKLYLLDGKEFKRVEQHKSYYPASGTVIVYNPADGIPTPTPTPTPADDPAATPTPSPTDPLAF